MHWKVQMVGGEIGISDQFKRESGDWYIFQSNGASWLKGLKPKSPCLLNLIYQWLDFLDQYSKVSNKFR